MVACSDATDAEKAAALASGGTIMDGTADNMDITNALTAITTGDIYVSSGTATFADTVFIPEYKAVRLSFGCTVEPSADVDLFNIGAGGALSGGRINTTGISWTSDAVVFDGNDQSTIYGSPVEWGRTLRDIEMVGKMDGDAEGNAIHLECDDATWTDPDGGSGTGWSDISNAHDENTGTYAYSSSISDGVWGDYLVLTLPASQWGSNVRYWVDFEPTTYRGSIDVDYYDGTWRDIYLGAAEFWGAYDVETFTDDSAITQIRIRFQPSGGSAVGRVFEYDIGETESLIGVNVNDVFIKGFNNGIWIDATGGRSWINGNYFDTIEFWRTITMIYEDKKNDSDDEKCGISITGNNYQNISCQCGTSTDAIWKSVASNNTYEFEIWDWNVAAGDNVFELVFDNMAAYGNHVEFYSWGWFLPSDINQNEWGQEGSGMGNWFEEKFGYNGWIWAVGYSTVPDLFVVQNANDHNYSGYIISDATAGESLAWGDFVYFEDTDDEWYLVDADVEGECGNVQVGMCLDISTDGSSTMILIEGYARHDAWDWTDGEKVLYFSTTDGDLTETPPSGSDDVIRVAGRTVSPDIIYFDPSMDYALYNSTGIDEWNGVPIE